MNKFTRLLTATFVLVCGYAFGAAHNSHTPEKDNACTLTASISSYNSVYCYGGNSGSATVTQSGGTAPYTYSWAPSGGNAATASNLTAGIYTVTVTDAALCTATASVIISQPVQLTGVIPNDTTCSAPATLTAAIYGGVPPYTYSWSNGATTYNISGLGSGTYTLSVMDGNGCTVTVSGSSVVESSIPGFTMTKTITNATCVGTLDGSIVLSCSGATAPFRYEWGNTYGDSSYNNINPGAYTVTIRDKNNNCNTYSDTVGHIDTCNYIFGTTFNDTNFNCVYNTGEPTLSNSYITITPGSYVVYPNWAGSFSQYVPYGTYTVSQNFYVGSPFASCSPSQVVTVNAVSPNVDFPDTTHAKLSDPMISYFYAYPFSIGDTSKSPVFQVKNNGTDTSSGKVYFIFYPDSAVTVDSTTPAYASISHDTVYWNYSGLLPGDTLDYAVHCSSMNIYAGRIFALVAAVKPNEPESNINNDYMGCALIFADSYDPNGKQVSPAGSGPNGYINLSDSVLTYFIHFQNTGTSKSQNIYIVDTISSNLDINTLNVLGASNAYSYMVTGNRVKFIFSNINLPDSSANPKGSTGWIEYQVKQAKTNGPGDVIKNTAYIYFDYNPAVATNTTVNTINVVTGVQQKELPGGIRVYPNPNDGVFAIKSSVDSRESKVEIYNMLGEEIYTKSLNIQNSTFNINMSSQPDGIYMLRITNANGDLLKAEKIDIVH